MFKTRISLSKHSSARSANRPFPSSKIFHFQNEAKYKTFLAQISLIFKSMASHLALLWNRGFGRLENGPLLTGNNLIFSDSFWKLILETFNNRILKSRLSRFLFNGILIYTRANEFQIELVFRMITNTVKFSVTWSAAMQIYCNKWSFLEKIQLPEELV